MLKSLLVVCLPGEVGRQVSILQKQAVAKYGLTPPKLPPHITLIPPVMYESFFRPPALAELARKSDLYIHRIVSAFRRYRVFGVTLAGVHRYRDEFGKNVISLSVGDPTGMLKNLQKRLRKIVYGWRLQQRHFPARIPFHVTIAEGLTDEQAEELIDELTVRELPLTFRVTSATWLDRMPGEQAWFSLGRLEVT